MKKFLGVLVAITLCACMLVPMASAAEGDLISDVLAGIDLGELSVQIYLQLFQISVLKASMLKLFSVATQTLLLSLKTLLQVLKVKKQQQLRLQAAQAVQLMIS